MDKNDTRSAEADHDGRAGADGGIGGTERAFDRRSCLKLAGGAAASLSLFGGAGSAAGANYETITLSRGDHLRTDLHSGETFENVLIDATAGNCTHTLVAYGDDWTIRNVAIKGQLTGSRAEQAFNLSVSGGGSALVENLYLGDGTVDGNWVPIFVPLRHAGTLTLRHMHVAHWPNNGLYASAPGREERNGGNGVVRVESCYAHNNNIDGFRLGTDGSYVKDSVVHVDRDLANVFGGKENGRGVWVKEGGHVTIRNCDILLDHPDSTYGVYASGDSVARVVNSRIAAPGGTGRFTGNVRTRNVSRNPDPTPPAGVPMSAREAASGSGSSGSGSGGPGVFTISNRGLDSPASYEFAVDGALEATDSVNDNDELSGSAARGQVNGGTDSYRVAGSITDFRADGPVELFMDGEQVDPDTPNRFRISNRGLDSPASYEFAVDGALAATDSVNDNDELSGSVARGQVNGGADAYYYGGSFARFGADGPVTLYVNGRETDPASLLGHELRIEGTNGIATYDFSVSGALAAGPEFDDDGTDAISDSRGEGQVNTGGADDYRFAGEVERFDHDGDLELYVDGTRVDPDSFGPDHTLSIVGDGTHLDYQFTVSGDLQAGTARGGSLNGGDEISGSSARGAVGGGTDSYAFSGEITDFTVSDSNHVAVYVDGERVDPDSIVLAHEVTISNGGSQQSTYQFTVSGTLRATETVNGNDEIAGSSARGQVNGGSDTYRYSGRLTDFSHDGPLDVQIDGKSVYSTND